MSVNPCATVPQYGVFVLKTEASNHVHLEAVRVSFSER